MWISFPVSEQEMRWIEQLGGPWRFSKDELYRQSGVDVALVVPETWKKWNLPEPPGPILSLRVADKTVIDTIVEEGARWIQPIREMEWGVRAGFLRFPSGMIVEITD